MSDLITGQVPYMIRIKLVTLRPENICLIHWSVTKYTQNEHSK